MAIVLTIAGLVQTLEPGWRISEPTNARAVLTASVVSEDGSVRPAKDDEVTLVDGATTVFGGYITGSRETGVGGRGVVPIVTTFDVADYSAIADRRFVVAPWPAAFDAGSTTKEIITALHAGYLAEFGVTLQPGMGDGITWGAVTYDLRKLSDVLTELAAANGWYWRITADKVLQFFVYGFNVGPDPIEWEGDLTVEPEYAAYANNVICRYGTDAAPLTLRVADAAEMAAHGTWEAPVKYTDVLDEATATILATAELAKRIPQSRTVIGTTLTPGWQVGQSITLTVPARNLSGPFVVDNLETFAGGGGLVVYRVTMRTGTQATVNWRNTYASWSGGGTSSTSAPSIIVTPAVAGRASYPLGGSMFAGVQSSGPTLVRGLGGQVQLDSVALAGASVTAVVTCRAFDAGVGVTPKIVDVTHSAVVGTGALVTSVTPVTVVFPVTPGAGECFYELHFLPSVADADVAGTGYLEVGR